MLKRHLRFASLFASCLAAVCHVAAQLPQVKTDLRPGQMAQGAAGCSTTEASS